MNSNKEIYIKNFSINNMRETDCEILVSGLKEQEMEYYFCSCDENQQEPICKTCVYECHERAGHTVLPQPYFGKEVCHCGMKGHRVAKQHNKPKYEQTDCLFMELNHLSQTSIFYQDNRPFCLYCYVFCHSEAEMEAFEHTANDNNLRCSCMATSHVNKKTVYSNLKLLFGPDSPQRFKDLDLTPISLVNNITTAELTYNFLFSPMEKFIDKLVTDGNLNQKEAALEKKAKKSNYFTAIKAFSHLAAYCKDHFYFNDKIKHVFRLDVIKAFLRNESKLNDYALNFFYHYIRCYKKLIFNSYFNKFADIKVYDFENYSPTQRLAAVSRIKENADFRSIFLDHEPGKSNAIGLFIQAIERMTHSKISAKGYKLLGVLTNILKKFSKFYLFTNEQIYRYCLVIDNIFTKIRALNESSERQKDLSPMVNIIKTLLFFIFSYNDNLVKNTLLDPESIEEVRFFHSKNDLGKLITKNLINLLNNERDSIEGKVSYGVQKLLLFANQILAMSLSDMDFYNLGLKREITPDLEYNIKLLNNEKTLEEQHFLDIVTTEVDKIESSYQNFFQNLCSERDILFLVEGSIVDFLDRLDEQSYAPMRVESASLEEEEVLKSRSKSLKEKREFIKMKSILHKDKKMLNVDKKRILVNYSNYVFTVTRVLTIIREKIPMDCEIIPNILKLLTFYVNDNQENCVISISQNVLSCLAIHASLHGEQIVDFYLNVTRTLAVRHFPLIYSNYFIKTLCMFFSNMVDKPETNQNDMLGKILLIFKFLLLKIPSQNHKMCLSQIMNQIVRINQNFSIFREIKSQILGCKNESFASEENLEEYRLYVRFLNLINATLNENSQLYPEDFLESILSAEEIQEMLRLKIELDLRVEVVKFFRMTFVNIRVLNQEIAFYRSLFVNPVPEVVQSFDQSSKGTDLRAYRFLEALINTDSKKFAFESQILIEEMKRVPKLAEEEIDQHRLKSYVKNGILLPLIVYFNKVFSVISLMKGTDILKVYNVVVISLLFKRHILENHPDLIMHERSRDDAKLEDRLINGDLGVQINHPEFTMKRVLQQEMIELDSDVNKAIDTDFPALDFVSLYALVQKHVFPLIDKPKSQFYSEQFEVKDIDTSQFLKENENKLVQEGLLTSESELVLFRLSQIYQNQKRNLKEASIVSNFGEINLSYEVNYRNLLIRFLLMIPKSEISQMMASEGYKILLKLLQLDTENVQNEIANLVKESADLVDLGKLTDIVLGLLINIIFDSFNLPEMIIEDKYKIGYNIVKIFKFLCEDHNNFFQSILLSQLYFDNNGKQVSFFNLMLMILNKLVLIAGWDRVKRDEEEVNEYFYDFFSAIVELLIEIVQGTEPDSFCAIMRDTITKSEEEKQTEEIPLFYFLTSIQTLLFRDSLNSEIIYNIRRDLVEFILAFLEEKRCSPEIKKLLKTIYRPIDLLNSILSTLKKYYIAQNEEENEEEKETLTVKSVYDIKSLDYIKKRKRYKEIRFNKELFDFFSETFSHSEEFIESPEYVFASTLYRYFKIMLIEQVEAATLIYEKTQKINVIGAENGDVVVDESVLENYYIITFFEKIFTKIEIVTEDGPDLVIFTKEPILQNLSVNSKNEFLENVKRENRFVKLSALMEVSDYFYDEIAFYSTTVKSAFVKKLNQINYASVNKYLYFFACLINLLLLIYEFKGYGPVPEQNSIFDVSSRDLRQKYNGVPFYYDNGADAVEARRVGLLVRFICMWISLAFAFICFVFVVIWFITKFPFYYEIRKKAFISELREKNQSLKFTDKLKIAYEAMFYKGDINILLLYIFFAVLGGSHIENLYLCSFLLFGCVSLSKTINNVIFLLSWQKMELTLIGVLIFLLNYVFGTLSFYFYDGSFQKFENGVLV